MMLKLLLMDRSADIYSDDLEVELIHNFLKEWKPWECVCWTSPYEPQSRLQDSYKFFSFIYFEGKK